MMDDGAPVGRAGRGERTHLADGLFAELGAEILRGVHVPGDVMPAERLLAERFGVSKLVVRAAVHRLAEAGLVEVRQGGATRVRDPREAGDLRVIELYYRLAPESAAAKDLANDVLEKQFTQGLSLLSAFERRASDAAREALVALTRDDEPTTERELAAFEERFWMHVAREGKNRILAAEVRWWYRALAARPSFPKPPPVGARAAFYRGLAARLRDGGDALAFYAVSLGPAVDALFTPKNPRKHR